MEYRRLGRAGMKVSAISIGAWLTYGGDVEYENAKACLHTAIENGINFIDVADVYAHGEAEKVVGKVIKDYNRTDLVISTKAFWPMSDNINDRGLSRKHIIESVEKSLRRFDIDYVDIFFCHRPDPETPIDETVRAIEDLMRQGKILYWGTSMWTAANINDAVAAAYQWHAYPPVTEQPVYNMLQRDQVEGELETAVTNHGIGLVVWSPLAQGVLTGKYNDGIPEGSRAAQHDWVRERLVTEENIAKARKITELAKEMGTTPARLALAWAMKHPNVSSVITGASRPEQVTENLGALEVTITGEIEQRIEDILQNRPEGSHR